MVSEYLEIVGLIERLHRQFLDVLKEELDRLGINDINNVQSMILYNIGNDQLNVGDLTQRGCYLGTNVTYNLKKLVDAGYVTQQRSSRDRRAVQVRLSEKGAKLHTNLGEVFAKHSDRVYDKVTSSEELARTNDVLRSLQRFWSELAFSPVTQRRDDEAA